MRNLIAARLAALAIGLALAGGAAGQATRTWVSGVGDDANDCSRIAPCKTFAGAISKTAAGGEIDALDSGGFGAVTITKSITLEGGRTLASVLVSGTNGIVVNGANAVVVLRGLSITDAGAGVGTGVGINFLAGAALYMEDCKVNGFAQGIAFTPASGGRLHASNVEVSDNSSAGIALSSGSAAAPSVATLTRVRLSHNGVGLQVLDNARASVYDSAASGNGSTAVSAAPSGTGAAEINLEHVVLSDSPVGVQAAGLPQGSAIVRLSKVVALDDGASAQADANARLVSFGNNRFLDPAPGPGNFAVNAAPASAQVKAGESTQLTVTVAPGTGFTGSVALACANLPAGASCSFSPPTVALAGTPASAALTVSTVTAGATLASATRGPNSAPPVSIGLLAVCMLALSWVAARRRGAKRLLPWAALCAVGFLASCNHGGGSDSQPVSVAPGTYTFQVTGTASENAVRNLSSVALTVTP
jgi:hypothetical protein